MLADCVDKTLATSAKNIFSIFSPEVIVGWKALKHPNDWRK
jgi:hypothetical protein